MAGFIVVVADTAVAQLYTLAKRNGLLKAARELQNPAAHQHSRDLGTDRPGRTANSATGVRHALQSRHDLKKEADAKFAATVVAAVARAAKSPDQPEIVLVAGPRLLGQYRKALPATLRDRVAAELPSNLAKLPLAELNARVRAALWPAPVVPGG
jgi:protein required for attachment to host cells